MTPGGSRAPPPPRHAVAGPSAQAEQAGSRELEQKCFSRNDTVLNLFFVCFFKWKEEETAQSPRKSVGADEAL